MSAPEELVKRIANALLDSRGWHVNNPTRSQATACERDARAVLAALDLPEATERVQWGTRLHGGAILPATAPRYPGDVAVRRTVTKYAPVVGPWEQVDQ